MLTPTTDLKTDLGGESRDPTPILFRGTHYYAACTAKTVVLWALAVALRVRLFLGLGLGFRVGAWLRWVVLPGQERAVRVAPFDTPRRPRSVALGALVHAGDARSKLVERSGQLVELRVSAAPLVRSPEMTMKEGSGTSARQRRCSFSLGTPMILQPARAQSAQATEAELSEHTGLFSE
ncbi:hypothetical protein N657DRAFT_281296 [Parathielavia appendiculata]|uniref:Uncharacterized protein n=1 Tax=Parathielavia appendiculata TaxID=2587402 RepID=A0AAN6Z601_9PEZI|nr:hypothetical protein N657DRAFT_281296 [Parathielavia appendiculata]